MLLYALLHLTGYDLPLEELKRFRQLHSKTPGHPEAGLTPGVETTTGPLGQGLANAVGMALAERMLARHFNRPGFEVVDHRTYTFVGDGCLMEGVSHEVCSLAGVLGLGKLVVIYDDNGISIDGDVRGWFRDDTAARFRAYGWNVIAGVDGHDPAAIDAALAAATTQDTRPTLVVCRTHIGFGSPEKVDTAEAHGAPLGAAEVARTRERLQWTHPPFEIPQALRDGWNARPQGAAREAEWQRLFGGYAAAHPALAAEFERRVNGALPSDWPAIKTELITAGAAATAPVATRKASQQSLGILTARVPELVGGSADLTGSNLTDTPSTPSFDPATAAGNYLHYGVREFGMAALMNGMALHGGVIPYGGTFLVFSDYARNAIRMSALTRQRVVYVFTHDSIGLGEDGPTHQPVEHAASLRLIPGLDVWRPGDAFETAIAWSSAIERSDGPAALLLSRQNLAQAAAHGRRRRRARRIHTVRSEWRRTASDHHSDGLRGHAGVAGAAAAAGRRPARARGVDALHFGVRTPVRQRTATRCCRWRCPRWPSKPVTPKPGGATSGVRDAWWASRVSASRRRHPRCTHTSASPAEAVAAAVREVVAGG